MKQDNSLCIVPPSPDLEDKIVRTKRHFPTPANADFTATSTPGSKAYDGSDPKISVTRITRSGDTITAEISVGSVVGWQNNMTVSRTFASNDSQNAWAYVNTQGWRKIKTGSPDGVTNIFVMLNAAKANSRPVDVYIVNNMIERVVMR